jgi:hypothetical protein
MRPRLTGDQELEITNFGHPSDDWPLRTLLSFHDRTPSAVTDRVAIKFLGEGRNIYHEIDYPYFHTYMSNSICLTFLCSPTPLNQF